MRNSERERLNLEAAADGCKMEKNRRTHAHPYEKRCQDLLPSIDLELESMPSPGGRLSSLSRCLGTITRSLSLTVTSCNRFWNLRKTGVGHDLSALK